MHTNVVHISQTPTGSDLNFAYHHSFRSRSIPLHLPSLQDDHKDYILFPYGSSSGGAANYITRQFSYCYIAGDYQLSEIPRRFWRRLDFRGCLRMVVLAFGVPAGSEGNS